MKNLNLRSLVVGPVMTNCYFLQNKETTELILVDPGAEAERISKMIEKLGKKPVAILLTHGHYDHMMAVNELRQEWAQLRAQLGAQPMNNNLPQSELLQKSGHTEGTNTKKEEREYIDISLHQKKENTPDGVSKKDKLSSPSPSEKIDYSGLMEYYNTTFKDRLQQIRSMTDVRKKAVKARIAQYGKESVRSVFNLILQSPFLLGANDRNWKCDFDWIFKQANFTKILEGNYNGTRLSKNQQDSEQRKRDSVLAVATTVREAAAKKRKELEAEGVIE